MEGRESATVILIESDVIYRSRVELVLLILILHYNIFLLHEQDTNVITHNLWKPL